MWKIWLGISGIWAFTAIFRKMHRTHDLLILAIENYVDVLTVVAFFGVIILISMWYSKPKWERSLKKRKILRRLRLRRA